MKTDIEIAREATLRPIVDIAESVGLAADDLHLYGRHIAKVPLSVMDGFRDQPDGKMILVTAMTPTKHGEGKTTTTIGLTQALARLGKKAMCAIREPSLGPCMGMKGGAAGGGYSQVLPMEEINLHFTGDLHAVSATHNLLAAVADNHLHHRGEPEINPRKLVWKRVIDMNDRSLRSTIVGLEGRGVNGVMREDGFEITAASEIMAIWGLSHDLAELKARMAAAIVGYDSLGKPVRAGDIGVAGAMAALMKNAMQPNLVQTIEGVPALVHGGPFANIAHGCNTIAATKLSRKLAEYTVTEAGFGADLGAEKFFHIKCRIGRMAPAATVLVVTRRAYALHGIENVTKHVENLARFGIPLVVSINRFAGDEEAELGEILAACRDLGVPAEITDYRESGGEGGLELAQLVAEACERPSDLTPLYPLEMPIEDKVRCLAEMLYGADGVDFSPEAEREIKQITNLGYGDLPICVAKTPSSLSDNPKLTGSPRGYRLGVTSARISAGAGFVVIYTGKIMTMPGLPRHPAALDIDVDGSGRINGLF
ncbi:MAG: formate--tetrahydrofolate ligase [Pseudomonadota bacterium]|nr:formate--tetrahydrofolate ligase [Pseudomonadota bacterium]